MSGKRNEERDERVKLPLDPEAALRALLAVNPDDEPAERDGEPADDQAGEDGKRQSENRSLAGRAAAPDAARDGRHGRRRRQPRSLVS
jgi:hypothetical protein